MRRHSPGGTRAARRELRCRGSRRPSPRGGTRHGLVVRDGKGEMDVLGRRAAVSDWREGPVTRPEVEPSRPVLRHVEGEHRRDGLPEPPARSEFPDAEPEVIDQRTADVVSEPGARLDAVSIGIEEEPAVVVRVVLRAWARLTVTRVSRVDSAAPEVVDLLPRVRGEPDVEVACHRVVAVGLRNTELVPLEVLAPLGLSLEQRLVEAPARLEVRDADRGVVEHQWMSIASPKE